MFKNKFVLYWKGVGQKSHLVKYLNAYYFSRFMLEAVFVNPVMFVAFLFILIIFGIAIGVTWNPVPRSYYRRQVHRSRV